MNVVCLVAKEYSFPLKEETGERGVLDYIFK